MVEATSIRSRIRCRSGRNALLAHGHTIENSGWFPTYYNNGPSGQYVFPKPDMQKAYEQLGGAPVRGRVLQPGRGRAERGVPPEEISPDEPRNLGAKVNVWTGDPVGESVESIAAGIRTFLRVIAQKTWGSQRLTASYAEFARS